MTVAELTARISVIGEGAARQALSRVGNSARSMGEAIRTAADAMHLLDIATAVMARGSGIQAAMSFDAQVRGLAAYSANAEQLTAQLGRLQEIAKLPGVGLSEVRQGVLQLEAAGMAAEMAERSIKAFGNAIALAGRGKEDLAGAVLQMSQMVANGKLAGDELNIIAERIPQIRKQMKLAFGTSSTEEIAKMGLSIDVIVEKIISGLESLPQATTGAITTLDNLSDALEQALLPIGRGIVDMFMTSSDSAGQLLAMIGSVATSIGQIFTAVASSGAIQEMFQILINGLGGFGVGFEQTMVGVMTHMMSIAAFIPQLFQAVLADVQMMVSTFFNNFATTWKNIFSEIGAAFSNIGVTIYNAFVLILDPVVAYINALTGNIFKLKNLAMKELAAPELTHIREYKFETPDVVNRMSAFQQRAQANVLAKMGPQPALPAGSCWGCCCSPPITVWRVTC